jgi:hypothetical protein
LSKTSNITAEKSIVTSEKRVMPLQGTIRNERGYTGAERGQAEDDPHRFYGLEREKKAVPWCLFKPPVVARQRKHVEENIFMAGTFLTSFTSCHCIFP